LMDDHAAVDARLHSEQSVLSACKVYLDRLSPGTQLEQVAVATEGRDLKSVRAQIKKARAEIAAINAAPAASPDIKQRIAARVTELAGEVSVSGIGGGQLRIKWPGAEFGPSGHDERSGSVVALLAALFPDALVQLAMADVERQTSGHMPMADRPARVAVLEAVVEELSYVEEALVSAAIAEGEQVSRSPSAPPAAVLGVRVKTQQRVAA
jgi:hypothetical protein